jgi:hypothetical protein
MTDPFATLLLGRTLAGRYEIQEMIGRGGMSVVYRAIDPRLGRSVALKVVSLPGGHGDRDQLRARLRREAASAARIPPHPNVVQIYDYGTDSGLDLDFIVMELLAGTDLKAAMAARQLGDDESVRVLIEAARGLAAGHRAGIVHRDVKPANIFLLGRDRIEVVKILDFGIAKALEFEGEDDLTQAGPAPHSPAYASPEQLDPSRPLSATSDVYQLGLVAYELLTGARPYTQAERERLGRGEPVQLPSLGRWDELPAGMRAAIARALAPRPADRYADAAAFAEVLARTAAAPGTPALGDGREPGLAEDATLAMGAGVVAGGHEPVDATLAAPPGGGDSTQLTGEPLVAEESVPDVRAMPLEEAPGGAAGRPRADWSLSGRPARPIQVVAAALLMAVGLWAISNLGGDPPRPDEIASELDTEALDREFRPLVEEAAGKALIADGVEEGPAAAEEVERVIVDLNSAWVEGDLARHMGHYADRVDFYNSYGAPRSYIERERRQALERYPERAITIDRSAITFPRPGRARALVDKSWKFEGDDAEWTGSARQELLLELRNGVWRVTGERDVEVYESDREG